MQYVKISFLEPKDRAAKEMTTQIHSNSEMGNPKVTTLKKF